MKRSCIGLKSCKPRQLNSNSKPQNVLVGNDEIFETCNDNAQQEFSIFIFDPNQRVPLSSTHHFNTKGPHLYTPKNPYDPHQKPLSSTPKTPRVNTKNLSVPHTRQLHTKTPQFHSPLSSTLKTLQFNTPLRQKKLFTSVVELRGVLN